MRLRSSSFEHQGTIPEKFTCKGGNVSPELFWEDAPKETKSFALILHDPDAPGRDGFTHWLLYNIPRNVHHIREGLPKNALIADSGLQGRNDAGELGYMGPCPPFGQHRYFARLYALRQDLNLPPGASAHQVTEALNGKVIEQTELLGIYGIREAKV